MILASQKNDDTGPSSYSAIRVFNNSFDDSTLVF